METTTTNLADFKIEELEQLEKLLDAAKNGYPSDFDLDGVQPLFNRNTGDVFLTNDSGQFCTASEGELFSYYILPESGCEGTIEDLINKYTELGDDDREVLRNIVSSYYNDDYTLPKKSIDGEWVEYDDECYYIDEEKMAVLPYNWYAMYDCDNEEENLDVFVSFISATEELKNRM